MKKFLAGFFLPLCIFLVSGFGPGYAYAYRGSVNNGALQSQNNSTSLSGQDVMVKSPSGKGNFRMVDATEIQENEESSSSKKHPGNNHNVIAIFCLQLSGCLNLPTRKTLSLSNYLFELSSQPKHLVFGVIRI